MEGKEEKKKDSKPFEIDGKRGLEQTPRWLLYRFDPFGSLFFGVTTQRYYRVAYLPKLDFKKRRFTRMVRCGRRSSTTIDCFPLRRPWDFFFREWLHWLAVI